MKTIQENLAAQFLLGKLSEEENIRIEEEYFGKNDRFEQLLIAENDLIDAYVKDDLSSEDRKHFENRLLLNPKQRKKVEFAKALITYASNQPAEDFIAAPAKLSWRLIFAQILSARPLLSYSFAIVAFIFLGGAVWLAINNNFPQLSHDTELANVPTSPENIIPKPPTTPIENQKLADEVSPSGKTVKDKLPVDEHSLKRASKLASPDSRIEKPAKPRTIISTIILPLGLTRDAVPSKPFEIPAKADFANLQMKFEKDDYDSYFAVIETVEGQKIWSGKIKKPTKNKNENENVVTASIPAHFLKRGDYIITLKGLTKNGVYESISDYAFTIDRR